MGIREQYLTILSEDGRRVANRFAFSSLDVKGGEKKDGAWSEAFYGMYGHEDDHLPEDEQSREGNPANDFDPTGWTHPYTNHPANERSPMYHVTGGKSKWWFEQIIGARDFFGPWVIDFLYKGLVLDESNEVYDHVADDRGDLMTKDDRAFFCTWHPEWRGWDAWTKSLTPDDISVAQRVLTWACSRSSEFTHKWPDPGTPEAEAFIATFKESK